MEDGLAEQTSTILMPLGCILILKAIDADTGMGIPGANYWIRLNRDGREIRQRASSDAGKTNYPKSNELGETRMVVDPLQERLYGIWAPKGYRCIDADAGYGRRLELAAGKTLTVEFLLQKQPE